MKWLLLLLLICWGCEIQDRNESSQPPSGSGEIPSERPSPTAYASGWSEVVIISRYAKTTIDVAGHFLVSRNACFKEESGAMLLASWNIFANSINEAIKLEPYREEICFDTPEAPFGLDGNVEIKFNSQNKRMLYEVRGQKTCTTIKDPNLYLPLLNTINETLRKAMLEGCPNGRP